MLVSTYSTSPVSEPTPRGGRSRCQALDGRFAPLLISATVEHIVEAWEQATSGDPQPLRLVASQPAAAVLLEPLGEKSARLALREAAVDRLEVTDLKLAATRPQVQLDLEVSAVRYLWAEASGYLGGSTDRRHTISMTWTLELTDDHDHPWQLLSSTSPADKIPLL
jgi:hypothetical protein